MLHLYYMPTCPYCKKVIDFLNLNGFDYELLDVTEKNMVNFNKLMKIGGQNQVPFLIDDKNNSHMYDSDQIIEYLKKEI